MGHWAERRATRLRTEQESVPSTIAPKYVGRRHYAMEMHASELAELQVGDTAVFVAYEKDTLIDGQIVHIRTARAGLEEDTAKRVRMVAGQIYFGNDVVAKGKKTAYEPLRQDQQIIGILVSKYRDFS